MEPSRQVSREWIGRRVELSLRGESGTTTGQLLSVGEEGIELSEEIQDDPYGEGTVSEGVSRFYPHESIVAAVRFLRRAQDPGVGGDEKS